MVTYLQALKERSFRNIWTAQILAVIAQNLLNFALIILVHNLTAGWRFSNFAVALVVLAFTLPALLLGNLAGHYADKWDRRTIMIAANVVRGLLVLLYIPLAHHLVPVLLLTFVVSCVMQFFMPAEAATIPNIVPSKLLLAANSLFVFSFYACFILGYSFSAPIIRVLGENGPFYVTAAMFLLAGGLVMLLPKQRPTKSDEAKPTPSLNLWNQFTENRRFISRHPRLKFSIRQLTITQALVTVVLATAPALSIALLRVPLEAASDYLVIPVGVGMIVGVASVTVFARQRDRVELLQGCLVMVGILLTGLGLAGQLYKPYHGEVLLPGYQIAWVVAGVVFFLGMLNAIISSLAQTLLQESVSDDSRGKVFGALNMMINLAGSVPIIVVGLLSDLLSVTSVIAVLGGLVTMYALGQAWFLRKKRPGTVGL